MVPFIIKQKTVYFFFLLIVVLTHTLNAQIPDTSQYMNGKKSTSPTFGLPPDVEFKASVTGAVNQNIEFILKANIPNQYTITGNFVLAMQLFRVNITGMPQMVLGFGVMMPKMKPGIYKMNQTNQLDVGGYTNPQLGNYSFSSKSGSMTITKAEKHQSYIGTMDWFIDGSFEMDLENGDDSSKKINIKGDFKGMAIKEN